MPQLQVEQIQRVFQYKGTSLADPNPEFTPDEVMSFYAGTYPELNNGIVKRDGHTYTFESEVGTKG